ncbi:MAG: hypothetical protein HC903_24745 [Methylacidiphilales bacterium]|nr:hypothetical protein [Candidatus Methylacidiphilales bacterium]
MGIALAKLTKGIAGGLLAIGYFGLLLPATSQTTSETNKSSADLGKELVGQIRECVQGKISNPPSKQQALQAISMRCVFEVAVLEKMAKSELMRAIACLLYLLRLVLKHLNPTAKDVQAMWGYVIFPAVEFLPYQLAWVAKPIIFCSIRELLLQLLVPKAHSSCV